MNSILKHAVILQKDIRIDNRVIEAGTSGYVISQEYLNQSDFSQEDHKQLLSEANQAIAKGHVFVEFKSHGKCLSVPISDVY